MNKIRNMSEEDKIEYFISGLQPETGKKVAFEEPLSLVEAKNMATKVETYFTKSSGFRKEHEQKQVNYKWSQPYPGESRYERLYRAQRILQISRHAMLLDTVEPIQDVTDAAKYLMKFRL